MTVKKLPPVPMPEAVEIGFITAAMLVIALLSVSAAFGLSVFTDREGGVTVLLLRHVPG